MKVWPALLADRVDACPRAFAAVLVAMQMGVFLMRDQLSRALGVDVRTPEGEVRMNRGLVDFFSHPLLTPEQAAQLHAAMDRLQAPPPDSGAQDAARTRE
jgi:TetR/AcrR family transcriptional regulator, regulator of cefoperazone and chloramphenicol sensitivity